MTMEILKNEMMIDEQLDFVAGGNNHETAQDSRFLNDMGTGCDRIGAYRASIDGKAVNRVNNAWEKLGVTVYSYNSVLGDWFGHKNTYQIDGKPVSREDAIEYVAHKLGKSIDYNKYK